MTHLYDMYETISLNKMVQFLYEYKNKTQPNPFYRKYTSFLNKDGSMVIMTVKPDIILKSDYNKNEFSRYELDKDIDELISVIQPYLRGQKIKKLK